MVFLPSPDPPHSEMTRPENGKADQGVSIPGVRASLSAYLAHLVTCCERNASQRKTSNLKGYYHLINNSFEHHVRHRLQQ